MKTKMNRVMYVLVALLAMTGVASATPAVPEIDPASAGSALTLLAGTVMVLRDRLRSRRSE